MPVVCVARALQDFSIFKERAISLIVARLRRFNNFF